MKNFSEIELPNFSNAIPVIRNRKTESLLRILVHSDIVGVIIGRGGSTIKEIIEQTSAR